MTDQPKPASDEQPDQTDHWAVLASDLGADTSKAVDLERPPVDQPERTTKKERGTKAQSKKPQAQTKTHWQQLAGWLGIAAPPPVAEEIPALSPDEHQVPSVEPPAVPDARESLLASDEVQALPAPEVTPEEPVPPATFGSGVFEPSASPSERESGESSEVEAPAATSESVLPGFEVREASEAPTPAAKEAWERLGFEFKSKPEERPRRDEETDDLTLDGACEDAFADSYWDADSATDVVTEDDETEVRFTATGRGRESSPSSQEERPERSQRSRRRRRGGRRSESIDAEKDAMDDAERRLEESADLFDEAPAVNDIPDAEPGPPQVNQEEAPHERAKSGRPPHRRIPSWEEAVGVIVEGNMANRSRRDSGGRRDRGRRGRRRPSR